MGNGVGFDNHMGMYPIMTPKQKYEARRQPIKDQRMAEETAHATHLRKQAAADECLTVLLDGVKSFFEGRASLRIGQNGDVRFVRDTPTRVNQPM